MAMEQDTPQCSRGWTKRCPASKGPRCTCKCGGKNHGTRKASADDNGADETLARTPDSVLFYGWDDERPPRPAKEVLLAPDDRIIECVRLTRPGPFGDTEDARVYLLSGEYREQLPRPLVYHSPTGYEWGYGGSGPADLALNILALVVSPKEAQHFHHHFKPFVACLPRDGGRIFMSDVRKWINASYEAEVSMRQVQS